MNNKFTAIYINSWIAGKHWHRLTKMRRVEQKKGETVFDMLKREELDNIIFLFHGHSPMQGEEPKEYEQVWPNAAYWVEKLL